MVLHSIYFCPLDFSKDKFQYLFKLMSGDHYVLLVPVAKEAKAWAFAGFPHQLG